MTGIASRWRSLSEMVDELVPEGGPADPLRKERYLSVNILGYSMDLAVSKLTKTSQDQCLR